MSGLLAAAGGRLTAQVLLALMLVRFARELFCSRGLTTEWLP